MADSLIELEALREATRLRLTEDVVRDLRDLAETYEAMGDRRDRRCGHGLGVLLDMHDKLEALRHGS